MGLAISLFMLSAVLLIVAANRPVDQQALRQMVDDAIAERLAAFTPAPSTQELPEGFFTLAEVSTHSDAATSCWVVVDGLVFDDLRWPRVVGRQPDQLMLVVEKECRSVIFIDGATHAVVGRIDDLGHQLHAPTPSPDGRYVYLVARDGWLSKVDLTSLEVVGSVDVGDNSRGTGLTDDGKYLLAGNFEPNTAVLLDAETLEVVKVFEATGSVGGGPEVRSKVGGIVELGTRLYMVLKDVNAVWEIETADPSFPVRKYENSATGRRPCMTPS